MTSATPLQTSLRIGIIGGSGLGGALTDRFSIADLNIHDAITTPFGAPSGPITTGVLNGTPIAFLARHGPGHCLNPAQVPYRANIFALKTLGCSHILASGATGSLREEIRPGDLVVCDQLVDRTVSGSGGRARTFFDHAAVHVEFADPMCSVMRSWLMVAAGETPVNSTVHPHGTYLCIEGPSFSTRAESQLHRLWGADVVGMTALPEARLAREAEMAYALIALPTDYDSWRTPAADHHAARSDRSLLEEIIGNLKQASANALELIAAALQDVEILRTSSSPAHSALDLGIWTDKRHISQEQVTRLAALWGKHFS